MPSRPRVRRIAAGLAACALTFALFPAPASAVAGDPIITPSQGSWVEGTIPVVAMPSTRGDQVTSLALDGTPLDAATEYGDSTLEFDVATNSIEARYGSYLLINGNRLDLTERDYVNERVALPIPNEWLVAGENTVTWQVGTFNTSCGTNYDDYVVSAFSLTTGGPVEADPDNRPSFSMGDGNCGSNASLLKTFDVQFTIGDDPSKTTGLAATVDTTTLSDGQHTISATTQGGGTATSTINVNNGQPGSAFLSPGDGTTLHGTESILASNRGSDPVRSLSIDGQPLETLATLGSGTSYLRFSVASNAAEARFRNYVVVNGFTIYLDETVQSRSYDLPIPSENLLVGENTIEFRTGALMESCGLNNDDFDLSKISLIPSQGTATGVGIATRYQMGDGSCGTGSTRLTVAPLKFTIDAPPMGLRADVDTTAYADGKHIVKAVTESGAVSQRTYRIDNSAPAVTSTIDNGDHLTTGTVLQVNATDATGVAGEVELEIDGTPVVNGATVGTGMKAGTHTLKITATDVLGNTDTTTLTFTTASIPDAIVDAQATESGEDVVLSATVTDPDGGDLTATFYRADANLPAEVTNGHATELPTTLDVSGEKAIAKGLMPSDDNTIESIASEDLTYQRFDIPVEGLNRDGLQAQWQGIVDPARSVSLYLWNTSTAQWELTDSARGKVDGNTGLSGAVASHHVDGAEVHALVVGDDPFADDIAKEVDNSFADPSTFDFSIAHFSDTQYLSEGAVEQETPEERAKWQSAYTSLTQWIVDNAEEMKIAYAAHTGDITENNIRQPGTEAMAAQVEGEFQVASAAQKILDDAGIPNGVLAGNHDNWTGQNHDKYNQYFGPDRYEALSGTWKNATYGGPWRPGDNQNHYDLFTAGGLDFIAVHLSYGVEPEEIKWANEVLERYRDRNAILFSHAYLNTSQEEDGRNAPYSNAGGLYQFEGIVGKNQNVFLTLSGHHHGVGINVLRDAGEVGNDVVELLADYQFYAPTAEELGLTEIGGYSPETTLRFGSSFLRMLQFDVDRSELIVDTYSPYLNNFNATEYDLEKRYNGTEDDFIVPIELSTRVTSFATDAMALVSPTDVVLGTDTVASGETATAVVPTAQINAWFVVAVTGNGGATTSEIILLPGDLAIPRVWVNAVNVTDKRFGFEATGEVPDGATLKITWIRNGKPRETQVVAAGVWESGNQNKWADAQAVLLDADGEPVASSEIIQPAEKVTGPKKNR